MFIKTLYELFKTFLMKLKMLQKTIVALMIIFHTKSVEL